MLRKLCKGLKYNFGTEDGRTKTNDVVAHDLSDGTNIQDNHRATSSTSKTNKKAKIAETKQDGLIGAFKSVVTTLLML